MATALVLVITPGPDTVLVLSRTLASGTRAGLWTLAGTQAGNLMHAMLAGLGISTIILYFPVALPVLRFGGAAYLLYLAVKTWRVDPRLALSAGALRQHLGARALFIQGLTNNLVNPKVIPFFLALFPQFIKPDSGNVVLQSATLGMTVALIAMIWVGTLAVFVGRARSLAVRSEPVARFMQRAAALAFVGLAIRLVVKDR